METGSQAASFCYAAQSGSISRAAEQAMLSQPSVSLQIQALELEFKAKLFPAPGSRDPAHARRPGPLQEAGLAAGRCGRLADDDLPCRPERHRVRQAGHRRGRIDHPLHLAQEVIRQYALAHVRHRAPAAERHRPRRSEDAPQRRGGFRRRLDDRGSRRHQLHANLSL